MELARKYTDFSELTTPMINEFIDKIIVHAPEKVDGDRVQEIEIYLKFIGHFELPAPELTEEEIKRQEFLRKERARSRERYQKERSAIDKVRVAYGEKYDPMMMHDSKRDVANLLHEEAETRSIRERLFQKQHQQKQNKKKSRYSWER